VRLVAATNVNLEDAVKAGRFREDLYYRINVVPIELSSLRNRKGDILPLTEHFISSYKNRLHTQAPQLLPETKEALLNYPWPGNIRELENVIHRALLVSDGITLKPKDLNLPSIQVIPDDSKSYSHAESFTPANDFLDRAINHLLEEQPPELFDLYLRKVIINAYEYSRRNQVQTAKLLGISRNILRTHLKQFGLIQ
jgi:sigma-54-specific transcriptional regulator